MNNQIIIERIEELCEIHGFSINQALKNANLDKSIVSNLRKGSTPSVDKIKILADFFNVSTDYLIGRTNIKINPKPWEQISNIKDTNELKECLKYLSCIDIKNSDVLLSIIKIAELWNTLPSNIQKELKEDLEKENKIYIKDKFLQKISQHQEKKDEEN